MTTIATDPLRLVIDRLGDGVIRRGDRQYTAKCPAHEDRHASLSIGVGDDGRVLLNCHAGCEFKTICAAIGLTEADTFPPRQDNGHGRRNGNGHARRIVSTYDYTDRDGGLLYQSVRYEPKDFRQRRPDGKGGWVWSMKGIKLVLYKLPELMDADPSDWVFVCEGEKDVDRLLSLGLVATTNPMGAGKWRDEFGETLRGRRCCILPDNDKPGADHARQVAQSLRGVAADVRILELPDLPPKGDVSDWIDAGGTAEALVRLVENTGCSTERAEPVGTPGILSKRDPLPTARKFLADNYGHADGRRIQYAGDVFYVFGPAAYAETELAGLRSQAYKWLEGHQREVELRGGEKSVAPFQPTKVDVDGMIDALRGVAYTDARPPSWLSEEKGLPDPLQLLVARNGIFHLADASDRPFRPPTPLLFTCNALDYDFDPRAPRPDQFLAFLASLWPEDPDSPRLLQEWFGYCLTADTRQHKMLMLIGPPRSGKGTIARVLMHMLGLANVCGPSLSSLGSNFGLWPLIDKRLAVISDARLSGRTDQAVVTERLLSISGEDALTIDRKNLPPVTKKLPTRFMVCTNELPRLADSSGALAGRFLILTLLESFVGREDKTLTDRLLIELPGILRWSIEGWRRLQRRGHFVQPQAGHDAMNDLHDLASPIGAFVRDWCQIGTGRRSPVQELYQAWCAWCDEQGASKPGPSNVFSRDLRSAVPGVGTGQVRDGEDRLREYRGIDLKPKAKAELAHYKAVKQHQHDRGGAA